MVTHTILLYLSAVPTFFFFFYRKFITSLKEHICRNFLCSDNLGHIFLMILSYWNNVYNNNYRLITAYLLRRVNLDKIMHAR